MSFDLDHYLFFYDQKHEEENIMHKEYMERKAIEYKFKTSLRLYHLDLLYMI